MNRHRILAALVLLGLSTFCFELGHFLLKVQSWEVIWNPPSVGELLLAIGSGLGAIAAALGVNVDKLVGRASPTPAPPSEQG